MSQTGHICEIDQQYEALKAAMTDKRIAEHNARQRATEAAEKLTSLGRGEAKPRRPRQTHRSEAGGRVYSSQSGMLEHSATIVVARREYRERTGKFKNHPGKFKAVRMNRGEKRVAR